MNEISEEKMERLIKAYDLEMTVEEAAAYSDVSRECVTSNWKKKELKLHYKKSSPRKKHIPVETFEEDVFYKQDNELGFPEIKDRVEKSLGHLVDRETLAKGLDSMVKLGIYERISTFKDDRYKLADLV